VFVYLIGSDLRQWQRSRRQKKRPEFEGPALPRNVGFGSTPVRDTFGISVNDPGQPARYVLKSQLRPVWWRQLFRWLWLLDFRRSRPDLAIDMGRDTLWVTDPNSDALSASASLAQVTATPANCIRTGADVADDVYPVLVVDVPGMQPLIIGYRDYVVGWNTRFTWRGKVPRENGDSPAYALSGEDWLTLAEKFGLAPYLEDKARR
jgi:hypothetical protein